MFRRGFTQLAFSIRGSLLCRAQHPRAGIMRCSVLASQHNVFQRPQNISSTHLSSPLFNQLQSFSNLSKNPSDTPANKPEEDIVAEDDDIPEENLTLYQRFKKTYKVYGKLLIVVHVMTSSVWFGSFFYIVYSGLDVAQMLAAIGFPELILSPLRNKSLGTTAAAYILYKLATPLRYAVTVYGTRSAGSLLRARGRLPPIAKEDNLRSMAKETRQMAKEKIVQERKKFSKPK